MAGFPQLREAAWLYAPDDPWAPLALVRLLEHKDGSGRWQVRLNVNDPQHGEEPLQVVDHPDEQSARAALAQVYEVGRDQGEWRISEVEPY